jgi:hypothetical protein
MDQPDKTLSELWLQAQVKFLPTTLESFQCGDVVYYRMPFRHAENSANGPLRMVDPIEGIVENSSGARFCAKNWNTQWLKLDVVSHLLGDI